MFWPKLVFILLAVLTVGSAAFVALSRNLLYSAFALLGTFFGIAGLYVLLSADFLAATQVLLYCGGILILILFAVMLTDKIENVRGSNVLQAGTWAHIALGIGLIALLVLLATTPWHGAEAAAAARGSALDVTSTPALGRALLLRYVLPFEAIAITILAALVGSVMIVRKEIRPEDTEGSEDA